MLRRAKDVKFPFSSTKLGANQRYAIEVEVDYTSKHEDKFDVMWQNYSPTYGWRSFYIMATFDSKSEAETWIKENS